jgi:hypothetical protein
LKREALYRVPSKDRKIRNRKLLSGGKVRGRWNDDSLFPGRDVVGCPLEM